MIYLQKTRRRGKTLWYLLFLIVLIAIGFFAQSTTIGTSTLHRIGKPLWRGYDASLSALSSLTTPFRSKSKLLEENNILKSKLEELRATYSDYELTRDENTKLKALLGREDERFLTLVYILKRPTATPYDVLLIDAGESIGVRQGQKIYSANGSLIGIVSETFKNSAFVDLFTSPSTETVCIIEINETPATCKGRGGGNYEIQVSLETEAPIGTNIFYPGIHRDLLGQVEEIINDNIAQSTKRLLFKSAINIQRENTVLIDLGS